MIPAMSLATRCTACGTIFRVVQDQLRVSEGWVRCGRCAEVFDAREQLFDIDREAPPTWPAEEPAQAPAPQPYSAAEATTWQQAETTTDVFAHRLPPAPPEPEPEAPADIYIEPEVPAPVDSRLDSRMESRFIEDRQEPQWIENEETAVIAPLPAPAEPVDSRVDPPAMAMGDGPDVVLTPSLAEAAAGSAAATAAGASTATAAPAAAPLPSFMREADRAQRWRRPGVRIALGLGAGLLLTLLGLQVSYHFRDAIVALYPQTRPSLQALCELGGCELQPWRRIDALSVESSALNPAGSGGSNQFQLTVNLRNKAAYEVATPWIELNLSDAAGTVLMRRMLAPSDFRNAKPAMAAGAEQPLQLLLSTGDQRVIGYSVEIFHP